MVFVLFVYSSLGEIMKPRLEIKERKIDFPLGL